MDTDSPERRGLPTLARAHIIFRHVKPIYVRLVVSALLLFLLTRFVDFSAVGETFRSTNPIFVAIVLGLITLDRVVMALKWNILLQARGVFIRAPELVKTYYISSFVGFFLPATVGVDGLRLWRLSKHRLDMSSIAASIVMERLIGLIVLSLFALPAILFSMLYVDADLSRLVWLDIAVLVALSAAVALSVSKLDNMIARRRFEFFMRYTWFAKLQRFYESYREYRNSIRSLVIFGVMTGFELTIPILANYYVASALNLHLPLAYFIGIIPIILFLARVPLPFDIIGVQEGLYVVMFSLVGVAPSQALSIGILQHLLVLVGMLPGLVLYMLEPMRSKKLPV